MQQINDMLRSGVVTLDENNKSPHTSFKGLLESLYLTDDTWQASDVQTRLEREFDALRASFDKDPGKTVRDILENSADFTQLNYKLAIIGISPSIYGHLREENRLLNIQFIKANADNIVKRWSQYNSPLWKTMNGVGID